MDSREWVKLDYLKPKKILIGLREIAKSNKLQEMDYKDASLRTRELRQYGENRQCALFCYGMSQALGINIKYAQFEKKDYDFVAFCEKGEEKYFIPIQMKELVPFEVNSKASLQSEINKLKKYSDSKDLVVAFHINRIINIVLSEICIPPLSIGAIWLFGAKDTSQNNWILIGNIMKPNVRWYEFAYPDGKSQGHSAKYATLFRRMASAKATPLSFTLETTINPEQSNEVTL